MNKKHKYVVWVGKVKKFYVTYDRAIQVLNDSLANGHKAVMFRLYHFSYSEEVTSENN